MDEMKVAMEVEPKVFRAKVLTPVVHKRLTASLGFVPLHCTFKSSKSRRESGMKVYTMKSAERPKDQK